MGQKERGDTNFVALAGEFAVLSQLALRRCNAGMTLGRTKNIDILVADAAGRQFKVEVKTNLRLRTRGSIHSKLIGKYVTDWQMDIKHEAIKDPRLFYCFVHIYTTRTEPLNYAFRFFIVPSAVVAKYVRKEHRLWVNDKPGRRENKRRSFRIGLLNDRRVKVPAPLASTYENNWDFASTRPKRTHQERKLPSKPATGR